MNVVTFLLHWSVFLRTIIINMDSSAVTKHLKSGVYKLKQRTGNKKSELWENFQQVQDGNYADLPFAACKVSYFLFIISFDLGHDSERMFSKCTV